MKFEVSLKCRTCSDETESCPECAGEGSTKLSQECKNLDELLAAYPKAAVQELDATIFQARESEGELDKIDMVITTEEPRYKMYIAWFYD